jgi:Zn-dependent membrane protease YugP
VIITKLSPLFFIFGKLKRVISILFLSAYLFSFTELHQLLKIPVLIEFTFMNIARRKTVLVSGLFKDALLEKL